MIPISPLFGARYQAHKPATIKPAMPKTTPIISDLLSPAVSVLLVDTAEVFGEIEVGELTRKGLKLLRLGNKVG
jgi:hypothetical protein